MNDLFNPDVLNCIANLSNDEVFTSPELANKMLDLLPEELWHDKKAKFLDPFTKSGVFLREIAKRLLEGLKEQIPDLQERIDHIMHNQLYGIAITELTSLLARRSLYCSKYPNCKYSVSRFDTVEGNIRFKRVEHTWKDGKCIFCGASKSEYDRGKELETHAYEWIHVNNPKEILNMRFDVIIGNPPYQLSDGGAGASAKPLYNLFITNAKKMNPKYISMIIPSRWFAGGKGLDEFRIEMLNDDRFKEIYDFPNPKECFPSNNISGGVMYFLWQNNYHGNCKFTNIINDEKIVSMRKLNEFDIFIRYNNAISIIHKVIAKKENKMVDIITSRKPFGLDSFERGHSEYVSGDVKLVTSSVNGYYRRKDILVGRELIDVYKVIIGKALSGHIGETDENGQVKVLARVEMLPPQYVCTESYLCIGKYKDEKTALNLEKYLKTKFVRFLLLQALTSMNITKDKFQFVPVQDFSKSWTDEELYTKYNLTDEEIAFIESMIKPME